MISYNNTRAELELLVIKVGLHNILDTLADIAYRSADDAQQTQVYCNVDKSKWIANATILASAANRVHIIL